MINGIWNRELHLAAPPAGGVFFYLLIMLNRFKSPLIAVLVSFVGTLDLLSQYQPDVLGTPYECQYLDLKSDRNGGNRATLIRRRQDQVNKRSVLYIHGYNDYFFQTSLADSVCSWGYDFYALDLRKYGRSILPGQRLFECNDVGEYQEEIDKAIDIMRAEGQQDIYLMAHSTGCLIAALYLHDTINQKGIRGLILNSPFIDYQSTVFNEQILLPLVTSLAWLAPNAVIIKANKPGSVEAYAQSLLSDYHGLWEFNYQWKRPEGYPIRASWLRAIKRGHRRVQAGLDIQIPILLLSSTRSILPQERWEEEYARVDVILDVEDMWKYGAKLGREVQFSKIPNGIHDLVLSPDPQARYLTYATISCWLRRIERSAH